MEGLDNESGSTRGGELRGVSLESHMALNSRLTCTAAKGADMTGYRMVLISFSGQEAL